MRNDLRRTHWNDAYVAKGEHGVSWHEDVPDVSLELIHQTGATARSSLVDIGGGASHLVDALLRKGMRDVAVLDISTDALKLARKRLGAAAEDVEWIAEDVTAWKPNRTFDLWHDRATFHFLTEPVERAAYIECLQAALRPGGHAIIATFAPDGPERCSGLPVVRYDPAALSKALGPAFRLLDQRRHVHTTPWGANQAFQYSVFRRDG